MENNHGPDSSQIKKVHELKGLIATLKQQITIEKDLWTQEIWEYNRLRKQLLNQLQEKFQPPKSCLIDVHLPQVKSYNNGRHVSSSSSDNIRFTHAMEMKYQSMRHLAANAYREKLLEVEQLCQLELNRVKENAAYLEPLKGMVSSWHDSAALREEIRPLVLKSRDMSSGDQPEHDYKTDMGLKHRPSSLIRPLT